MKVKNLIWHSSNNFVTLEMKRAKIEVPGEIQEIYSQRQPPYLLNPGSALKIFLHQTKSTTISLENAPNVRGQQISAFLHIGNLCTMEIG